MNVVYFARRVWPSKLAIGALAVAVALTSSASFAQGRGGMSMGGGMGRGGGGQMMGQQGMGMGHHCMGMGQQSSGMGQQGMGMGQMGMTNRTMNRQNFSTVQTNAVGQQIMQNQQAVRARVTQSQIQCNERSQRQLEGLRKQWQTQPATTKTASTTP